MLQHARGPARKHVARLGARSLRFNARAFTLACSMLVLKADRDRGREGSNTYDTGASGVRNGPPPRRSERRAPGAWRQRRALQAVRYADGRDHAARMVGIAGPR